MGAQNDRDRCGLLLLPVLMTNDAAVPSGGNVYSDRIAIMDLNPVDAHVHPAVLRVAYQHHAAGTDVISAVQLVPEGSDKLQHVDVLPLLDVFHNGSPSNGLWSNGLEEFQLFFEGADEFQTLFLERHSQRYRQTLGSCDNVSEHPLSFGMSFDFVEEQR